MIPAYSPYILMLDDKYLGSRTSLVPSRLFFFFIMLFSIGRKKADIYLTLGSNQRLDTYLTGPLQFFNSSALQPFSYGLVSI